MVLLRLRRGLVILLVAVLSGVMLGLWVARWQESRPTAFLLLQLISRLKDMLIPQLLQFQPETMF